MNAQPQKQKNKRQNNRYATLSCITNVWRLRSTPCDYVQLPVMYVNAQRSMLVHKIPSDEAWGCNMLTRNVTACNMQPNAVTVEQH